MIFLFHLGWWLLFKLGNKNWLIVFKLFFKYLAEKANHTPLMNQVEHEAFFSYDC